MWKNKTITLSFPDTWDVNMCKMKGSDGPLLNEEKIKEGILNPIKALKLSELAKGKSNVVIVVDDLTRSTPVSQIIPYVIDELHEAGVNDKHIMFLLALGAHRPMTREDCILKLGKDIVDKYNIENHHPYENLTNLGESSLGTPIDINTTYYNADLKIALGGVIPHPLAGFGGGAKIILPGISGIKTLEANHSAAVRAIGIGIGKVTKLREDIEEIVGKVGLDFSINAILTERGSISGISSGHFIDAHRKAIEIANVNYKTTVTKGNQICFFNSYPEDSELNQAIKSLNLLMTAPRTMLDKAGAIVLMTSSHEGRGYHSLLWETGAKLYQNLGDGVLWRGVVRRRKAYLFCPNISEADFHHIFPESVKLFKNWDDLIEELTKEYGESPKAAIFPCSIQLCE